jgi:hypothetical protein
VVRLSVTGTRGGIGCSTLAWAIARELEAFALLDYSEKQGVHWIIGEPELDFTWPKTLDSGLGGKNLLKLLSHAKTVEGVAILSGGEPIKFENCQNEAVMIFDGAVSADLQIKLTTNALQDIQNDIAILEEEILVLRKVRGGIPVSLINRNFGYIYPSEYSVGKSLSNGLGLHSKSKVQQVARQICADISANI